VAVSTRNRTIALVTLAVAAAAGVVNGLLRRATVHEAVQPGRIRWPRVPVAPLAVVLTMVASVFAQGMIGAAAGGPGHWRPPILTERLPPQVRHAVIAIAGHDSFYRGRTPTDPLVERFSYRGLDARSRPLPYDYRATHRSLESSAALLAAQVDAIHRRTGRPVALIGQSEGTLVARAYLKLRPRSPVDTVLLVDPLVRPGRAYIPPPQSRTGWGSGRGLKAAGYLRPVKPHPESE
jgi:pimeloyl-ACP methyl ester carboxylesterase